MYGQEDIRELALATFSALEEAELIEALEAIHVRVFTRDCATLFRTTVREENVVECSLNPMVELLLRHIADIACQEALSRDERQREIAWVLDVCGF